MRFDVNDITTILFDADGTLWDFEGVMRHAMGIALREIEHRIPASHGLLTVKGMVDLREEMAVEMKKEKGWTHEKIRYESFRQALASIGVVDDAFAVRVTDLYLKHRFEDIRLFVDAAPVLAALRERYVIGLLTNGNTDPERCGLPGLFNFTVFSEEFGFEKPDPRLFAAAIERAGCTRHQIVNVGDSLEADVAGAKRVGIAAVWLNRLGKKNTSRIQPDYTLSSLEELLPIFLSRPR